MNALVFGGTGFIGRRVVEELLTAGDRVTIATSGFSPDSFGEHVSRLRVDRFYPAEVANVASSMHDLDVVYDLIAFGPDDVKIMCDEFRGKIDHYVFVSSAAVYEEQKADMEEGEFDPLSIEPAKGGMKELGYADGKRNAEAYLSRHAPFTFSTIRFPVVLGHDDVAGREQFPINRIDGRMLDHVSRIVKRREMVVPPDGGKRNYAWVEDAGRLIAWAGRNRKTGAYNGASSPAMNAREIIERIGQVLGKEPKIVSSGKDRDLSTFYSTGNRSVNTDKVEREGFEFTPFEKWFPEVVMNSLGSIQRDSKQCG